ncbi:hypothetical protein [Martelella alba]|uniref:Uncharacterized protein n=1 Tax=Martelella alba TaxID=2590451 RepID=A0ABY2SR10_9HYPH|nr:hypothetical protein [Martelella alba]TKI06425.1 hypothetical protein FCN80_10225 [Martelella alba]
MTDKQEPIGFISGRAAQKMLRGYSRSICMFPEPTREYVIPVYLDAPAASRLPDGYKLVPIAPTNEMLSAAREWTGTSTAEAVYIKMLEAAPSPISDKGGDS